MKTRFAVLGVMLTALVGCGSPSSPGFDEAMTTPTSSQGVSRPERDEPIDVPAKLVEQGFKSDGISAIEKNAAYWLMPFRSPFEMSLSSNGRTSCMFRMVNTTYPDKGALAEHPITSNSIVKLRVRLLNPDGSTKADLTGKVVEIKFRELTPSVLSTLGLDLSGCADKTPR